MHDRRGIDQRSRGGRIDWNAHFARDFAGLTVGGLDNAIGTGRLQLTAVSTIRQTAT